MFSKILNGDTQKSISIIGDLEFVKHFYLAGGTGCALHIGHRLSYDLDFFSQTKFDLLLISRILENTGDFIIDYSDKDTLIGKFNNTRVSFMYYKCGLVSFLLEKVDHASLRDRLLSPVSAAPAPAAKELKEKRLSRMAIWGSILGVPLAVIALVVTIILSSSSDKQLNDVTTKLEEYNPLKRDAVIKEKDEQLTEKERMIKELEKAVAELCVGAPQEKKEALAELKKGNMEKARAL
jgi:hypothetical protein